MNLSNRKISDTIFIFGISHRVGTNLLQKILNSHPDTAACPPIWEDFLTAKSQHLVNYVNEVESKWGDWKNSGDFKDEILSCLGEGLVGFLSQRSNYNPSRLLTKTPSIDGLENFQRLFPDTKCVILIRDGRSVVASRVKGFSVNFEHAARQWSNAAASLSTLSTTIPNFSQNHLVIRYESLVENLESSIEEILNFFSLDKTIFDFSITENTPIYGSSFFRGEKPEVHWTPVPHTDKINTFCRWQDWTDKEHDLFHSIAGDSMKLLDYNSN